MPLEAETSALIARFTSAPSALRQGNIDLFIKRLKAAGAWSKLDVLYCAIAHDAQAAQRNWIADQFNLVPVGGMTFVANSHYVSDGTTGFLNTGPTTGGTDGYVMSNAARKSKLNDTSSCIILGAGGSTTNIAFGVSAATYRVGVNPRDGSGNFLARCNDTSLTIVGAVPSREGAFNISRSSATEFKGYRNKVLIGTPAVASVNLQASNLTILRNNAAYINAPLLWFWAGGALTEAEYFAAYDATVEYQAAVAAEGSAGIGASDGAAAVSGVGSTYIFGGWSNVAGAATVEGFTEWTHEASGSVNGAAAVDGQVQALFDASGSADGSSIALSFNPVVVASHGHITGRAIVTGEGYPSFTATVATTHLFELDAVWHTLTRLEGIFDPVQGDEDGLTIELEAVFDVVDRLEGGIGVD
jgi:hypothetical protein